MKLIYRKSKEGDAYVTDFKQVSGSNSWSWDYSSNITEAAEFTLLEVQLILKYAIPRNEGEFALSCLTEDSLRVVSDAEK